MTLSALSQRRLSRVWLDFFLVSAFPARPYPCLITLFPDAESLGASMPWPGKSWEVLAWAGSGKKFLVSHPIQG